MKKNVPNPTALIQPNLDTELVDWVRQIIALDTVEGFIAAYHYNLILCKKKGLAYEETERVFEHFYQRRKYLDREVFYSTLSRQKNGKGQ